MMSIVPTTAVNSRDLIIGAILRRCRLGRDQNIVFPLAFEAFASHNALAGQIRHSSIYTGDRYRNVIAAEPTSEIVAFGRETNRDMRKLQIISAAVILLALAVGLGMRSRWRMPNLRAFLIVRPDAPGPDGGPAAVPGRDSGNADTSAGTPENTVYAMLNASREGNLEAYFQCYAGEMETSLRGSAAARTELVFGKALQDSARSLRRAMVAEPQRVSDKEARVRVEYVYADHQDASVMYLDLEPGGWKIVRVERAGAVRSTNRSAGKRSGRACSAGSSSAPVLLCFHDQFETTERHHSLSLS